MGQSYWRFYHDAIRRNTQLEESARRYGQEPRYRTNAQRAIHLILDRIYHLLGKWCDVAIYERMVA